MHKRENEFIMNTQKYQDTADLVTFTDEILNGKLHFLCIDIQIYIPILYVTRMTQNKNDSILQHGRLVGKYRCVVFPTSGFSYLTLCPRQCQWKVATTYLAIRN